MKARVIRDLVTFETLVVLTFPANIISPAVYAMFVYNCTQ